MSHAATTMLPMKYNRSQSVVLVSSTAKPGTVSSLSLTGAAVTAIST